MQYIIFALLSYIFTIWMIGGYVQEIAFNLTFIFTMVLPIIFIVIGGAITMDEENKLLKYFGRVLIVASICFYIGFIFVAPLREFIFTQCGINLPHKCKIDLPMWKWICIFAVDGILFLLMGAGASSEDEEKKNHNEETSATDKEMDTK